MDYKLVAIDVDGTLINREHKIPPYNKEVIKRIAATGVKFVIASGRNDLHVKEFVEELGIHSIVIGCNGGSVRDLITGEVFVEEMIDKASLQEVLDLFERENIYFKAFSLDKIYVKEHIEGEIYNSNRIEQADGSITDLMEYIIAPAEEIIKNDIIKVVIDEMNNQSILDIEKKLSTIKGIEVAMSSPSCIDISKLGTTKGKALKFLAEKLGIERSEIVAIGDGGNDIGMLSYAGLSVAMENGNENLKKIADMIAENNENSGVGKILTKIFEK